MTEKKQPADKSPTDIEHARVLQSGTAWNGQAYKAYPAGKPQISVMRMSLPAHSELPWHTHPMPNTAYILSGQLTVEDKHTGERFSVSAGQALNETIDSAHRGYTSEEPTELLIFYAGVEGQELSLPLPGEEAEF
ncbi:MAG TPA: cupin [Pantoea sp.]|uniref:cupin domain-containing protein n=1 Tax=Pantoea piersonii TaxID=2364647 RepID=UPI000EE15223|nr:cupin domain-containing protein [Pantoea piersonii]HCX00338.1 cupin [Pantoea sp.]